MGLGARRDRHDPLLMCASVLDKRHPLGVDDFADVPDCPDLPYHGGRRSCTVGACFGSARALSALACVEEKLAGPYDHPNPGLTRPRLHDSRGQTITGLQNVQRRRSPHACHVRACGATTHRVHA